MSDERILLTAEQAEAMLPEGETVHNYRNPAGMMIGCDWERDAVILALRAAQSIEIGGPACKAMRHPLVVFGPDGRHSFFEADMAKVEAHEAAQ